MITASWSLQRAHHGEQPYWAVMLLASALGQIGLAGRRFRLRLWLGRRHRRAAAGVPRAGDGDHQAIRSTCHSGGAHLRLPAAPGRAATTSTASAEYLSRHPAGVLGGRQSIPPSSGHQQAARALCSSPKPSSCTSRGGQRPRAMPTSCCRRPRRSSATTSAARARDKFIIAMQQAVEPVGEARNDFAIFSALAQRLGCAERLHPRPRRDGVAAPPLRWLARTAPAPTPRRMPDFDTFWANGYLEIPAAAEEYVLFADFRADPEKHKLGTPSGRIELYSEKIAGFGYDDCPPHATWIEPWEWLGAHLGLSAASHVQPAARSPAQPDGRRPGQRARQGGGPRGDCHQSGTMPRSAGIKDGDVVRDLQFARRLPRRRDRDRYDVARGREALVRGLVRSGRRRGRRGLRAWQCRMC